MEAQNAFKLIDILRGEKISEIDVLGGEPMLVPWIMDFAKTAAENGVFLNISTNGAITSSIKRFTDMRWDFLNLGFSAEGFEKTHNALTGADNFSKLISGVKHLISKGKSPVVKSILTKENINELPGLISYFAEIGIKRYYLLHEDAIGRSAVCGFSFPDFWKLFIELKKKMEKIIDIGFVAASGFNGADTYRCDAGVKKLAVMPGGSVFPCNLLAGFKEFNLGNIFTTSLRRILENPLLEVFKKSGAKNNCKNKDCVHYLSCKGGCPAHSYYFYGSLAQTDPRCKNNYKKRGNYSITSIIPSMPLS